MLLTAFLPKEPSLRPLLSPPTRPRATADPRHPAPAEVDDSAD